MLELTPVHTKRLRKSGKRTRVSRGPNIYMDNGLKFLNPWNLDSQGFPTVRKRPVKYRYFKRIYREIQSPFGPQGSLTDNATNHKQDELDQPAPHKFECCVQGFTSVRKRLVKYRQFSSQQIQNRSEALNKPHYTQGFTLV